MSLFNESKTFEGEFYIADVAKPPYDVCGAIGFERQIAVSE
jgi:hypothetical protein